MAPAVLSPASGSSANAGADTSAPFSTTTLVTSIAIIVSAILGSAIVATVTIVVISIRRRLRAQLEATIAREFVPTVVVTDMTTYPHSTSIIDTSLPVDVEGCKPAGSLEKAKKSSTSPRGSAIMPIIHEEEEEIDLEEEKAEFLVAHPDEIEEFDQTVDHQFKTTEIVDVKRDTNSHHSTSTQDDDESDGGEREEAMNHRDSIQLYGSQNSDGSVFRSLHKTLDEHQELTSETSRYSWESEQSSQRSDSDIPVYPGEEDIASSSIEGASTADHTPVITPIVLESKTFTSSAASLLKQFWQFSSQESIRRKAAMPMHAPLSNSNLSTAGIFNYDGAQDLEIGRQLDNSIDSDPLDPAILKYCWHMDAQGDSPRGSMDTDTDRSAATLGDCVISNSYTTSKSLDSICFIERRSTEEISEDAHYYDIPITEPRTFSPTEPQALANSDSQNSMTNTGKTNSRRHRIDARKSKSASILDSLYLGRQNWNKKRSAKQAEKEIAMREFANIRRVALGDSTNFAGSH